MNKNIFLPLMIFTLVLTACASNALTPVSSSSADTLSVQNQLILGTLKLEATANTITASQAAELLPMWYVLQELNSSDTATQEEMDGLVSQIQAAMTDEQIKAITDMKLTPQDLMTAMQVYTGSLSSGSDSLQTGSTSSAGGGAPGGPPDMSAGGMPGGGDPAMAPIGAATANDNSATNQPAMSRTPAALFDAVIELLKAKVR